MEKRNLFRTSLIILACICISNFTNAQKVKVKKKKAHHNTHVKHKKHHAHHHKHFNRPYRYTNLPRCGTIINVRPQNGNLIAFKGVNYHFHNGIWYKPYKKKFIVFRPVVGVRIKTLPINCYHFTIRNRKYHYYYGTYYALVPKTNEYEVVQPPLGAKVDELPDDCKEKNINGETYYELDETFYSYIESEDLYQIVDPQN